jgi:hypothetical protein
MPNYSSNLAAMDPTKLPPWLRITLVAGIVVLIAGAILMGSALVAAGSIQSTLQWYAVAVMVNYGNAQVGETVRAVSDAVFRHFALVAGATPFGTRVDPALLKKPGTGSGR